MSDPALPRTDMGGAIRLFFETYEDFQKWLELRTWFNPWHQTQNDNNTGNYIILQKYECRREPEIPSDVSWVESPQDTNNVVGQPAETRDDLDGVSINREAVPDTTVNNPRKRKANSMMKPKKCTAFIRVRQLKWDSEDPEIGSYVEAGIVNQDKNEFKIVVDWGYKHDHLVGTLDSIKGLKMVPAAKKNIMDSIARGASWSIIKQNVYQPNIKVEKGFFNEYDKMNKYHFGNWRKTFINSRMQKHHTFLFSLKKWGDYIKEQGGYAELHTSEDRTLQGFGVWSFSFMTPFQRDLFTDPWNNKIWYVDSTHNIGIGIEKQDTSYLFTLMVKNNATPGMGTPVAFMITNSQTPEIVGRFFEFVTAITHVSPAQICCSPTAISACKQAWPDTIITLWHISRAFLNNAHQHLGKSDVPHAFTLFLQMRETTSAIKFEEIRKVLHESFRENKGWVNYFESQWIRQRELWASTFMGDSVPSAQMNDYIESVDSTLRRLSIDKWGTYRSDHIVYRLYEVVLPEFMSQMNRGLNRLGNRKDSKSESLQRDAAFAISDQDSLRMVIYEHDEKNFGFLFREG